MQLDTARHVQLQELMNTSQQQMTESTDNQLQELKEQCNDQFEKVSENQESISKLQTDATTALSEQQQQQVAHRLPAW